MRFAISLIATLIALPAFGQVEKNCAYPEDCRASSSAASVTFEVPNTGNARSTLSGTETVVSGTDSGATMQFQEKASTDTESEWSLCGSNSVAMQWDSPGEAGVRWIFDVDATGVVTGTGAVIAALAARVTDGVATVSGTTYRTKNIEAAAGAAFRRVPITLSVDAPMSDGDCFVLTWDEFTSTGTNLTLESLEIHASRAGPLPLD